jgi:hypothetical protein
MLSLNVNTQKNIRDIFLRVVKGLISPESGVLFKPWRKNLSHPNGWFLLLQEVVIKSASF